MRVIGEIENPYFKATIHQYNDKYLLMLTGGPMEQVYKFPKDGFDSLESFKKMVDERFIEDAVTIHKAMMNNYKEAAESIGQ